MRAILYTSILVFCITATFGLMTNDETNFAQKIVQQFQKYCPFSDLCYSDANQTFHETHEEIPCCGYCSCNKACNSSYGCCPDKVDHFLNTDEISRIKGDVYECVYAQFREISRNSEKYMPKYYTMVSRCPNTFNDEDIKKKCERDYDQFDFSEDFRYLPPVSTSENGRKIYKNFHCALCHNAGLQSLQPWKGRLICDEPNVSINKIQLSPDILTELRCELRFMPPLVHNWATIMKCESMQLVDRCNKTGRWQNYDMIMESACLSYLSAYKGFKNVHCFLCNGNETDDIEHTCKRPDPHYPNYPTSFISLLDFNDLEKDKPLLRAGDNLFQCGHSSVWDTLSEICRPLICPFGFNLEGDECTPLLDELSTTNIFEVQIILVPKEFHREQNLLDLYKLAELIPNNVSKRLSEIEPPYLYRLCMLNVYIKLKYSIENVVNLIMATGHDKIVPYMSHFEVIIQVSVEEVKNITETIIAITMLFDENVFSDTVNVRYRQLRQKYDQTNRSPNERVKLILGSFISLDGRRYTDPSTYKALTEGSNDPMDGLGVVLIPDYPYKEPCKTTIIVQPSPFCPRVELSNANFNISTSTNSITRHRSNTSAQFNSNFTSIIETIDGSGILVCADEYISDSQESSKIDTGETESGPIVIVTIICLVLSIASLVLTVIVYCYFPILRTLPGMNILALSISLIMSNSLSLTNSVAKLSPISVICQTIGILLHFSLLSGFSWMLVCTYHMMRVFLTIRERSQVRCNKKLFIRYCMCAEIVPFLIIGIVIIVSRQDSNGIGYGGYPCYLKNTKFILYFVAIPLAIVLILNITMFTRVTCIVLRMPSVASSTKHERNNLLIFLKLSSLTGIAWIFGFLYQFTELQLFAYLFVICNAGQGVFLMVSFVANRRVFGMICRKPSAENRKANGSE